jgi:CubicO group peptidase (beta-lactamase class C family)
MHRILISVLAILSLGSTVRGMTPAELDAAMRQLHERDVFHGVLLVTEGGETLFEGAYGLSDRERGDPISAASVFEVASVTKPMAAVAALRLSERGELDLDAPVRTHWEDFPYATVTARHLLTHTSGVVGHDAFFRERGARIAPGAVVGNDAILDELRRDPPPLAHEPGDGHAYSNLNFIMLAELLERISGQSFRALLQQEVFEPAGMRRAQVLTTRYTGGKLPENLTESYVRDERGGWVGISVAPGWEFVRTFSGTKGDTGVVSTAADLSRFVRALASGRLLSDETLDAMGRRATLDDGAAFRSVGWLPSGNGLGWRVSEDDALLWHTGDWGGYRCGLFWNRRNDRCVVYLTNHAITDWSWLGSLQPIIGDPATLVED